MQWVDVVALCRRWWWALVVVTLLVSGLSVIRWWRTPPVYVATSTVSVAVLPAGAPSSQASYLAEQRALAIARIVAAPSFLAAPAFDAALAHALSSSAPDPSLRQAPPLTLGRALLASHSGAIISLAASWASAPGAAALASAAAATLAQENPAILALFPTGDTPRFYVDPHPALAVRDAVADASARDALLMRLALAVMAGLLALATLGLLERRQSAKDAQRGWRAEMSRSE